MQKVVTFGEIMMRLAMPDNKRFIQALPGNFECTFAGAEANVAASLSILGLDSFFVTSLPDNHLSRACIGALKQVGINTDYISLLETGRLGVYFLETGANQRPSNVIYDRAESSICLADESYYDLDKVFNSAQWFHITGITPALSKQAYEVSLSAVKKAKSQNLTVSMDLNFRGKLWKWDESLSERQLARKCISQILPYVDVVTGNEEDAYDVLGIQAGSSDVHSGKLDIQGYSSTAKSIIEQFPNVSFVAITLRESISASHNNWGGMLYDAKEQKPYFSPINSEGEFSPYKIQNIVDRVGGGDSFSAGLIYALMNKNLSKDRKTAINFAVAASCLAHSIKGDFNYSTYDEILKLADGNASGRVVR